MLLRDQYADPKRFSRYGVHKYLERGWRYQQAKWHSSEPVDPASRRERHHILIRLVDLDLPDVSIQVECGDVGCGANMFKRLVDAGQQIHVLLGQLTQSLVVVAESDSGVSFFKR